MNEYLKHGGAQHSAEILGYGLFTMVKTLITQDQNAKPPVVLMHGNRKVSTKNLARQIGMKAIEPCLPEVANPYSGYLVDGTSPFGTHGDMPVFVGASILELPKILMTDRNFNHTSLSIDPCEHPLFSGLPGRFTTKSSGPQSHLRCNEYAERSTTPQRIWIAVSPCHQ